MPVISDTKLRTATSVVTIDRDRLDERARIRRGGSLADRGRRGEELRSFMETTGSRAGRCDARRPSTSVVAGWVAVEVSLPPSEMSKVCRRKPVIIGSPMLTAYAARCSLPVPSVRGSAGALISAWGKLATASRRATCSLSAGSVIEAAWGMATATT